MENFFECYGSLCLLLTGLSISVLILFIKKRKRHEPSLIIKIIMVLVVTLVFLIEIYGSKPIGIVTSLDYLRISPIGAVLGLVAVALLSLAQSVFNLMFKNISEQRLKLYENGLALTLIYGLIIFSVTNLSIAAVVLIISTVIVIVITELISRRFGKRVIRL